MSNHFFVTVVRKAAHIQVQVRMQDTDPLYEPMGHQPRPQKGRQFSTTATAYQCMLTHALKACMP